MKTYTKKQLAQLMQISAGKLQNLLNREWYEEIKKLGYKKNAKILTPKIVKYIFMEWGFEPD